MVGLHRGHQHLGLLGRGGHDAGKRGVEGSARRIEVAGRVADRGRGLRQVHRRVGRAHLQQPHLVGDLHRNPGGARSDLPQIGDRGLVLHRRARIGRRLGVMHGLQHDLEGARRAAGLPEGQLLGVEHVGVDGVKRSGRLRGPDIERRALDRDRRAPGRRRRATRQDERQHAHACAHGHPTTP